jgi:hypothetical protein
MVVHSSYVLLLCRSSILDELTYVQFTISGETESLGSNNIMGQWLKSIGGYTIEQIGQSSRSPFSSTSTSTFTSYSLFIHH